MIFGIMGAMPEEVDQLCARLQDVTCEPYAGVDYHCGTLQGRPVVVCCAGMGKANAASTVQVLCTRYGIGRLIFSGVAGNMTGKIGIGDVCVGETVFYHDAELDMLAQSAPFLTEYRGDPALVQAALDACRRLRREGHCGADRHRRYLCGGLCDQGGHCGEMPSPTVWRWRAPRSARWRAANGVPCVVLRAHERQRRRERLRGAGGQGFQHCGLCADRHRDRGSA